MKTILTGLALILSMTGLKAQPNAVENPAIAQEAFDSLLFKITNQGIDNETVKIETNKFGQITGIDSKQEMLKKYYSKPY